MKKVAAAVAAFLCIMGCIAYVPDNVSEGSDPVCITAGAAEQKDIVLPGINADKYTYKYADVSCYPHKIAAVKMDPKSKDEAIAAAAKALVGAEGKGYDETTAKAGGLAQSIYASQGYKLGIYSVTVTDGDKKIVEYHVGLAGTKETVLDLKVSDIEVPDAFEKYVETALGSKLADPKHVTMIADNAFVNSYLKTIDMTGVQIIGNGAFKNAAYITEITIPKSVKFVDINTFDSSGLKTLTVQNDMPNIPASMCANTKLTTITFAHPEFIRTIGTKAFTKTPIGEPIFNTWGEAKGYESLTVDNSAYEGCESITSVNMSDNVVLLSQKTFRDCIKLSSITFGKNTIGADKESFYGCTALDTITFSKSVQALGGAVFSNCTSLKKVVGMPDTIQDWVASETNPNSGWGFGNDMFAGDTSLISVELPKSITKIPEGAFMGCTALTSVYNNNNIVEIAKNGFNGCTSLLEADYPKLVSIQESGFENCTSLLAAKYPALTSIGKAAFRNCSNMSAFEVGKCTDVGDNALEGCTGLKKITLMSDAYGKYVFKGCANATSIKVNGAAMVMIPQGTFSECTALKTVDADLTGTTIIGPSAFSKCTSLEKTQFSNVRIVEVSAFEDCTSLVSITSGGKPISAEDYNAKCFHNCTALEIEVDGTISTIGANAFENSGIKKINLNGMTGGTVVIGSNAFSNCANLTDAKISASKVAEFSIGQGIFSGSAQLKKAVYDGPNITANMFKDCTSLVEVDTNATSIQGSAFSGCTMLEGLYNIDHSKKLIAKDIAGMAFMNCTSLKEAPCDENTVYAGKQQYMGCESLTAVKTDVLTEGMFSGCTKLEKVDVTGSNSIPAECFKECESLSLYDFSNVIEIGRGAFTGSGITDVKIDSGQVINSSAFQNCRSLKAIDVNVAKIDASAFVGCAFMDKAVICAETIGANAFSGCSSLKEVTLQTSDAHKLTSVGANAFANCGVLYEVIVPGSPTIAAKAFGFVNNKVNPDFVIVGDPGSSVKTYATTNKVEFMDVSAFDLAARQSKRHSLGDVDGNGVISAVDAAKMQSWILNKSTPGIYGENMDINKDGVVDIYDLALLKRKLHS